ncbi:MAG: hypothetical protein KA201_03910 [Kofleriaceae bacterium]|nr:hypothetical protein [Kofleriaceae bacterium]
MSRDRASKPDHDGTAGRGAAAHDQGDSLQQARYAVQLAEGLGRMPGVAAAAQEAIADRDYPAAIAAARAWTMHKPHVELIAQSMDPHDDFVTRAQALLDRMRPIEGKLPRNIFKVGIAELDREDEAEWLAQLGGSPKGGSKSSAYAGLHGKLEGNVGLDADVSVNVGRTSGPNLDLSPGDIAKGVLVPPWALTKPVRQRVLGADQNPVMHGVDDVLDGLINDTDYLSGFAIGAVHGTQAAIRDCQNAPIDLIKLIVGELKKFALDGRYDVLVRLRDMIKQAPAALELLGKRWNDDSDRHAQGEFQGEVVAYIGTQLAILIVTSFAGPLAEAFGPYAGVIRAIAAVGDPVSVVREIALGVRLSKEAEVALQAARKAQRAEALAADAAQGAAKAEQGAVRAEQAAGQAIELADDGAKAGGGLRASGVAAEREAGGAVPALLQDAAKPLSRAESLVEGLPADLRGRTRIVESPVLTDSTVLVSYRDGVELVVGAGATPRHIAYHAHTVRLLLRYEGLTGKIRRLIDKALSLLRVRPGYGTAGFEAELEVQKLTAIRDDLQRLLAKTDGALHSGEAVDPAILRAELESVEAQLAKHEQALGSFDRGRGAVAAEGPGEPVPAIDPATPDPVAAQSPSSDAAPSQQRPPSQPEVSFPEPVSVSTPDEGAPGHSSSPTPTRPVTTANESDVGHSSPTTSERPMTQLPEAGQPHAPEGAAPTPAEAAEPTSASPRAHALGEQLGITDAAAEKVLTVLDDEALARLLAEFGEAQVKMIATRSQTVLEAFARGLAAAGEDRQAVASLVEGLRLNAKGTLASDALIEAIAADAAFRAQHGNRIAGDFLSRFWRSISRKHDVAQARAELRLAEDLLAGRTAIGDVDSLEALAESPSGRTPEFRATSPDGAHLVESKMIGRANEPLTQTSVSNNVRSAHDQVRTQAARTGESGGGMIRLDGLAAGRTDVTPETLAEWVSKHNPSPRDSVATQWVEILYNDAEGTAMKVVLELKNQRFSVHSAQALQ